MNTIRIGAAVTCHSAATTLALTSYGDVSSWRSLNDSGNGRFNAPPWAELEIVGSTTIAASVMALWGMVLDPVSIAATTFTTTHASELVNSNAHGLLTGDGPIRLTNSGGALPAGYAVSTDYYVIKSDANGFFLAASRALAFAGTKVAISGDGTGTHTYTGYASGDTACERVMWLNVDLGAEHQGTAGLLGIAGAGAIAITDQKGYVKLFRHNPRIVAYTVVGTLDTGNVTIKVRPLWDWASM